MSNNYFTSPEGELLWPYLNTPDTQFDPNGTYHCKLAVDADDAEEFINQLQAAVEAQYEELDAKAKATHTKREVFEVEYDDEGEPTGRVIFKAKLAAKVLPRKGEPFEQSVKLFNAAGQPCDDNIWNGSKAILRGQLVPYTMNSTKQCGVSLRLKMVKVTDLVTGAPPSTNWDDFGAEDEGDLDWN